MFTKNAVLVLALVLTCQAKAMVTPAITEEEAAEQEIASLYDICGDNILCYFTQEEVRQGLGEMAGYQGVEEAFRMNTGEVDFSAELLTEFNGSAYAENKKAGVMTDISSRKKQPKTEKKSKPDSAPMSFKGISPRGYPIWASFVGKFRQCAKGCIPYIVSVNRPGTYSCHNGGRAIDVGGLVCGGKTYMAIKRGRYDSFVSCMKGKMKVLYRNGPGITQGHHDHAHFSNGCTVAGGRRYW